MATLHARLAPGILPDVAIRSIQALLHERFGVVHATVQVEYADCSGGCATGH